MKNKTLKLLGLGATCIFVLMTLIPACIAMSAISGGCSSSESENIIRCPDTVGLGLREGIVIIDEITEDYCSFHHATLEEEMELFRQYWEGKEDLLQWILW